MTGVVSGFARIFASLATLGFLVLVACVAWIGWTLAEQAGAGCTPAPAPSVSVTSTPGARHAR